MKKATILFFSLLLPLFINAQSLPPTGITPYTFNMVWNYMKSGGFEPSQLDKAEQLLTNAGYRKVGKFDNAIGYNLVYAKACDVKMSSDGFVNSASPNKEPGFSSYIQVGPGVGMDWGMSVTFMSKKGTNAFIALLNKAEYKFYDTDNPAWFRRSDNCYFLQRGKAFSVSDVIGGEDLIE